MALPVSRNTTYAIDTEVKSVDLNDIQDKIIDNHFEGPLRSPVLHGRQTSGSPVGTFDATGNYSVGGTADVFDVPLHVRPGTRLTDVRGRITDQASFGGGDFKLRVLKVTDGTASTLGTSATSDQSGTAQTLAVTGLTEDVPAAGVSVGISYIARFIFAGAGPAQVHTVELETGITP